MRIIFGVKLFRWGFRFLAGACAFHFLNVGTDRLFGGENGIRVHKAGETRRHFWVECLGGVAFVCSGIRFGCGSCGIISVRGLLMFLYLGILTIIAFIDWNTRIIYDRFHVMILLLGVVAVWVFPEYTPAQRMLGAVIVSLPMLITALAIPGAFGGGDIKLVAVSGWLLGWQAMLPAVSLGLLFAGVYCVRMLIQKKLVWKASFSFGPFLAMGLAIALFYGDTMLRWYLSI